MTPKSQKVKDSDERADPKECESAYTGGATDRLHDRTTDEEGHGAGAFRTVGQGNRTGIPPGDDQERIKEDQGILWIVKQSEKRPGKKFGERLAMEVIAVLNGRL
ncbi:hypothetical protein BY996DRAFT_6440586 [Phakopsora pachyrhizi]|nr:hypothetical protein BY996DRAFT_6440586 [Phakopsora pachyrhizi]